MGMTEYKPLTPSFRQDINIGFDKQIAELQDFNCLIGEIKQILREVGIAR